MAFLRRATALVVHPRATPQGWSKTRTAAKLSGQPSQGLAEQASEILGENFDPSKYLLTHCTLVASVDTEKVPGVKVGKIQEGGQRINRKYDDYRITSATDQYINNNCDAFSRPVLLKSYRTLIGAHNFCFAPGTRVQMADGTTRPIEDVQVGDRVISHTGIAREVVYRFERPYEDPLVELVAEGGVLLRCTTEHPFPTPRGRLTAGSLVVGDVLFAANGASRRVLDIRTNPYTGLVHNVEVAVDHSYLANGIQTLNCEHVQIEDQSKGRIIDAVTRDIGDSVYVDILVATHRKHAELVADIESGKIGTLSMGASVAETTCTKCGNVAVDETETCEHVRYSKGNVFLDERGGRHRIAELCGSDSLDENGGVTFIEASWVASPAFTGAVMRNIISPADLSANATRRVAEILSTPPKEWVDDGQRKAASTEPVADFDFGDGEAPAADGAPPAEKPSPSKLDELEDTVLDAVTTRVLDRVRSELSKKDKGLSPEDSTARTNDNLQASRQKLARAAYAASVRVLARTATCDADLMNKVAVLDAQFGREIPVGVYRAALSAGSSNKYASADIFLRACHDALGRDASPAETSTFVRLGRILSYAEDVLRASTTPDSFHRSLS